MIDPRFANGGAIPLVPGFGQQQVPIQQHHRHRHHRKGKHRGGAESPLSRDESIHKVGHTHQHQHHHHHQQQQYTDGAVLGGGYGVPYGVPGYGDGFAGGYQQQQQQQFGANFGFAGHQQMNPFVNPNFGGGDPSGTVIKQHRRHHHHHRQQAAAVASGGVDVNAQGVPEQLIGQRSSSVLGESARQSRSPGAQVEGSAAGAGTAGVEQGASRRHRHHRHQHHSAGQAGGHEHAHHSLTTAGADGYGHINDDLIFIERSEHSPHRQSPPPGYEYKGKIEVQGINKEYRSRSRGHDGLVPPIPQQTFQSVPGVQGVQAAANYGPCPPGWQQVVLTSGPLGPCPPGAPCPPGGSMYIGQRVGGGFGATGIAGIGGFGAGPSGVGIGGVGPIGTAGSGGGLANLAASLPFPAQGQLVADYIVESAAGLSSSDEGGGVSSVGAVGTAGVGTTTQYQGSGAGFEEQFRSHETEEYVSGRPTIIEVWQKRKHEEREKRSRSRSREREPRQPERPQERSRSRSRSHSRTRLPSGPSFDFDRFRTDILTAIERISRGQAPATIIGKWSGHDGGTQTDIHGNEVGYRPPTTDVRPVLPPTQTSTAQPSTFQAAAAGEVRVIVQPIQPVFYMPRQGPTQPQVVGSAPAQVTTTSSGGPNIVYVPRNVYVPVIKPVFVPRERVIVRPQIVHVARPVLVDRPVPVTQRPIIIDRERPVPVPVRGAAQGATQSGGSKVVREEYVYRDNLPVAYGGRCAEFTGGANYGYMPAQQEQQYAASSMHEAYQAQNLPQTVIGGHYQQSQSASHLNVQQGASSRADSRADSAHGSYTNLARTNSASAINVGHRNQEVIRQTFEQSAQAAGVSANYPTRVEVLDTAVNPFWQKTDQPTLMRRYGRPAYEIIHKSDEVEQKMYNELRQRSSSGGVQRSESAGSYVSSSGVATGGGGSFSSIPLGDIKNLNPEGIPHQGPAPIPVRINY